MAEKVLFFAVALVVILAFFVSVHQSNETKRLMADCMKDRKEYECAAMLKSHGASVVPVPVYVGR